MRVEGDDTHTHTHTHTHSQMLRELVPLDLFKAYTPEDWKKAITAQYSRHQVTINWDFCLVTTFP